MRRIVFSRAALFPWMGIALMAAGAAFPDGAVAGMVLLVIGANVAFYSLRDFSQNFAWGRDALPMLHLCGILFVLGMALTVSATQFDAQNRWLAALSLGLYFCLFAVWTAQQPVSWPYRILSWVCLLLMIFGGIAANLGWRDWRVFAESNETPQEITLADLQRNGFGNNRHIRLKEFRFCNGAAVEKPEKANKMNDVWVPIVPVDEQLIKKDGPLPPVPARITVVAATLLFGEAGPGGMPMGARPAPDFLRKKRETEGYECTVVTGIKTLKPQVREDLSRLGPQTDFAEMIVLDWRKPASATSVYGLLDGGAAALLLGLIGLCIVYVRARKTVGVDGWAPPIDDATTEPTEEFSDASASQPKNGNDV
jgi:hypothetical protein